MADPILPGSFGKVKPALFLKPRDGFDYALSVLLVVNDVFPLAESSKCFGVVKPREVVRQTPFSLLFQLVEFLSVDFLDVSQSSGQLSEYTV